MPVLISQDLAANSPRLSKDVVRRVAESLLRLTNTAHRELSLLLISDGRMAELNQTWRHRPGPTNVLAFPMDDGADSPGANLLGDIIISLDTAAREATVQGITLQERVTVLLIHGLLHLLGHDHEQSDQEADRMENEERQLLARLQSEKRREKMLQLAVNVDHVATLRQARGIDEPDPVQAASICGTACFTPRYSAFTSTSIEESHPSSDSVTALPWCDASPR
jgi:pyridoxine 5-phosphate synthase